MITLRSQVSWVRRFVDDRRGATVAILAISMATLIGFAGLGVETGLWFSQKRHYQTAADAASIAGAYQLANSASFGTAIAGPTTSSTAACGTSTTICGAAITEALNNGYTTSGNTITISEGTWSGGVFTATATSPNAVQAIITEPKNSLLSVAYRSNVTIGVSAVAVISTLGHPCILAMDNQVSTKQSPGILFQGSVNFNVAPCAIASNATGPDSILFQGGSSDQMTLGGVYASGAVTDTGTPQINLPAGQIPVSGAPPIKDPYQNVSIPSNACSGTAGAHSGSTYGPGVYNGLSINSNSTMTPGTYYVCNGDFSIKGATVTGTDVTIVLTGSSASSVGAVVIDSNAAGNLSAPDVGTDTSTAIYPGFLFIQDRQSSPLGSTTNCKSPTNSYAANASLNLAGTIYTPAQPWCLNGNPNIVTGTNCLQWVAWQILFQGNPAVADTGCPPNTTAAQITSVALVQ